MGRRDMMMNWSQENCRIDDHRPKARGAFGYPRAMGMGILLEFVMVSLSVFMRTGFFLF